MSATLTPPTTVREPDGASAERPDPRMEPRGQAWWRDIDLLLAIAGGLAFGLMNLLATMENHSRIGRLIAGSAALLCTALLWWRGRLRLDGVRPFLLPIGAVYASILVSCIFSYDVAYSLKTFLRQHLLFGGLFLGVGIWTSDARNQRGYLWGLALAGLYSAFFGILLYSFMGDLHRAGWVDKPADFLYKATDEQGVVYYRAKGLLKSYTRSAMVFIIALPAAVVVGVLSWRERRRALWGIALATIIFSVWYLLLTKSRGAWLAAGFSTMAACLLMQVRWQFLVGGLVAVLLAGSLVPPVRSRALTMVRDVGSPNLFFSGRIELWKQGTIPIRENILTGVGYGGDIFQTDAVAAPYPLSTDRRQPDLHQLYMQTLAEVGILGAAAYAWLVGLLVYTGVRGLRGGSRPGREGLRAALPALLALLLIGTVYYMNEGQVALMLWAQCGLIAGAAARRAQDQ